MLHDSHLGRRSTRGEILRDLTAYHSRLGAVRRPATFSSFLRQPGRARDQTSLALQLAFDSHLEPAPAGCRSLSSTERHMVFLSRDYALELQLEPPSSGTAALRGELLSRQHGPLTGIPTFLLDGDSIAGYAATGAMGEFCFDHGAAAGRRLCLLLDFDRCIDLDLDFDSPAATAG